MFHRIILKDLRKWSQKKDRKPLVIRGARQVGKTSLVHKFGEEFEQYLYLNLEFPADRQPFEQFTSMETLLEVLFFIKNKSSAKRINTLIFIDEIQACPKAFQILRYFLEQSPEIAVIAAGSLLETIFRPEISFPVGRVEFMVLRPVSFPEFLAALGEESALQQLENIPLKDYAQGKLLQLFHSYALIGGMPEIVKTYAETRDLSSLAAIYDGLLTTYSDDVEKYARNEQQVQIIRHVIRSGFSEAGKRIKFQGFGNSSYGSRDVGEALRTLEKTMLFALVYPVTGSRLPLAPNYKKAPRLQALDTGLMNFALGLQKEIIGTDDLSKIYRGTLIEHLCGQEILALQQRAIGGLNFWVREKKASDAEVDFILPFEGKLVPVEVKSGKEGKLRSLHQYMEEAPHTLAVRLYAGGLSISSAKTPSGKIYRLLNLPYFLASQVEGYLIWFSENTQVV